MAVTGAEATWTMAATTSTMGSGPTLQLAPTAATPKGSRARTTSAGVWPRTVCPSSSKVIWATTGKSVASRAARTATHSSSRSENVSRRTRSTPPSTSASTCSRKAS